MITFSHSFNKFTFQNYRKNMNTCNPWKNISLLPLKKEIYRSYFKNEAMLY